ncbi:interferon-induced 6-16 family-domain-containing protein [Obelidium mucronatum]|nr:interferon-induced 6-16 family-domain-containing protein [Obelidium mucronatum]
MPDVIATSAIASGVTAVVVAPVVISAIGFGAGGIVAGSWAAGMMSAAAIAGGGGVAAGSLVAGLQAAGAAGIFAGPIGWIVLGVGAGLGAGAGAIAKTLNAGMAGGRRYAGTAAPPSQGHWCIGTEEGWGNVRLYMFACEGDAWAAYNGLWVCRIMYNNNGDEVGCAGLNGGSIETIRREIRDNTRKEREAMAPPNIGPLAGCIVAFKTRHNRFLSAHPDDSLCVEDNPYAWETFRLYGITGNVNKYAARSVCHGEKFLEIIENHWSVTGTEIGENQTITLEADPDDNDKIRIKSFNNRYVSIDDDHRVQGNETVGEWERFQILVL